MKKLIALLFLFIAGQAFAGPSSGNVANTIMFGYGQGDTFSQQANVLTSDSANSLNWFVLNTSYLNTGSHYKVWWKQGVAYRVPNGSTAHCVVFAGLTAAANTSYQLAYDTSPVANDAAPPLAAGVWQSGSETNYVYTMYTHIWNQFPITFDFPSQSYPVLQVSNGDSSGQQLVCRETTP